MVHGDIHLTVALSRAGSSIEELCDLLEGRARSINRHLASHYQHAPVAEYLQLFNDLHAQHIQALKAGKVVAAHEILREIHEISGRLESDEAAAVRWIRDRGHHVDYCSLGRAHNGNRGPLATTYMVSQSLGERELSSSATKDAKRELVGEYIDQSAGALGLHWTLENNPVPTIACAIAQSDEYARRRAAAALMDLEPEMLDRVAVALQNLGPDRQLVALATLETMGHRALPVFIGALDDPSPAIRASAAAILRRLAPKADTVIPALVAACNDSQPDVRAAAAAALATIQPRTPDAIPGVGAALDDPSSEVRYKAIQTLAAIGAPAIPALAEALGSPNDDARRYAAKALSRIGSAAAIAVPALATMLGDQASDMRRAAAAALGKIGPAAIGAVSGLLTALSDADADLRQSALTALSAIKPPPEVFVSALAVSLSDPEKGIRVSAALILASLGPAAATAAPQLELALADPEPQVRLCAGVALGRVRPTTCNRR